MKRALVLEGGGAKGSYELGAILALKDIQIDCVVGTSIGAINGAFFVSNQLDELYEIWNNIDCKKILGTDSNSKLYNYLYLLNNKIDINEIKRILEEKLDIDKFLNSKINYGLVTYNLTINKELSIFKENMLHKNVIEYILASAYFPIFKFKKIINNNYYLDGGLTNNLPVELVYDYDEIIVIRTNKKKVRYKKKVIEIMPKHHLGNTIYINKNQIKKNIKPGYIDTKNILSI